MSFFWRLTQGFTQEGGISFTLCPRLCNWRDQWWDVAQASMPTTQGASDAKTSAHGIAEIGNGRQLDPLRRSREPGNRLCNIQSDRRNLGDDPLPSFVGFDELKARQPPQGAPSTASEGDL
jgi:hypothetical protein